MARKIFSGFSASIWTLLLATGSGCASAARSTSGASGSTDLGELQKQLLNLNQKVDGMEVKLSALNDKVDASRTSVETVQKTLTPDSGLQEVPAHSADAYSPAKTLTPPKAAGDPDNGFVTDAAVQSYRRAMVYFDSSKYAEAILAFTQFLDQFADHPWAGSAQFFVGKSYLRQKEFKLARQEFGRVLTSYDRSPHVAESLALMADCEDQLKIPRQAAQHRQQLLALYPNSPAATALRTTRVDEPALPANAPATAPVMPLTEEKKHP